MPKKRTMKDRSRATGPIRSGGINLRTNDNGLSVRI